MHVVTSSGADKGVHPGQAGAGWGGPVVLRAAGGVVDIWSQEDGVHSAVLHGVVGYGCIGSTICTSVGVASSVGGELVVEAVQLDLVIACRGRDPMRCYNTRRGIE